MTKKITKLIFPIIILIIGIQFSRDYFGNTTNERKTELLALKKNGKQENGILDSVYKEQTIKVLGIPKKFYTYSYSFFVSEKKYNGEYNSENILQTNNYKITYLSNNPNISSLNIDDDLKSITNIEGNKTSLVIGIIMILVAVLLSYNTLKNKNNVSY